MPTYICFLNWTEQAAKAAQDAPQRHAGAKGLAESLGAVWSVPM